MALGELGDVDLQDQQGDDDREDAVGQGQHAGRVVQPLHQGAGRVSILPRPPDGDLWLVGHRNLPPRAQAGEASPRPVLDPSHAVSTLILKRDGSGVTNLAVVAYGSLPTR